MIKKNETINTISGNFNNNHGIEESPPQVSEMRRIIRVMFSRWLVIFGTVIIALLIFMAIFAPFISPYDPYKQNLTIRLNQPSSEHLFGTDALGRDVLSRVIYGSRISLLVGIIGVGIAGVIGMSLGLIAGYSGNIVNNIIMRIMDTMMSLPPLVLALAISAALGGGLKNVMISLGIAMIPSYCRLMCAQVLSLKGNDYVTASRIIGINDLNIALRHILPNAFPPLMVLVTLNMGSMILAEAGLSFLGIGISPPTASWGSMISEGYKYLFTNPLLSFIPGITIALVVLSFNMVGDGLRDALDPRLRGTI
ncbi:MAG: ABC transporter permease [Dehalococcoidales bacterium]|nr:ABC transporter permease [Dehalococcoidales bacterium]